MRGWSGLCQPGPKLEEGRALQLRGRPLGSLTWEGILSGPDVVTIQLATLGHLATGASASPVGRMKQQQRPLIHIDVVNIDAGTVVGKMSGLHTPHGMCSGPTSTGIHIPR